MIGVVVNVRATVTGTAPISWAEVPLLAAGVSPEGRDGVWLRGTLPPGFELEGPATVVETNSAILLEEGNRMAVLHDGTLEIRV